MSDERLHAMLNHIPSLDKKQVASVKISFEAIIDVVPKHGPEEGTTIVPTLEVVFRS